MEALLACFEEAPPPNEPEFVVANAPSCVESTLRNAQGLDLAVFTWPQAPGPTRATARDRRRDATR